MPIEVKLEVVHSQATGEALNVFTWCKDGEFCMTLGIANRVRAVPEEQRLEFYPYDPAVDLPLAEAKRKEIEQQLAAQQAAKN